MVGILAAVNPGIAVGGNRGQAVIAAQVNVDRGRYTPDLPLFRVVDVVVDAEIIGRYGIRYTARPIGDGHTPGGYAVRFQIVASDVDVVVFATEGKLPTHRSAVALVVLRAGGNVGDEAVAIVIDHGEARRRIFAQRQVGDGGDAIGVVVAHFPGDQKLLLLGRLLGDHADGARHRVLAEQCALRAPQDLYPFKIEETRAVLAATAHVNAIDVHTDRLLKTLVVA